MLQVVLRSRQIPKGTCDVQVCIELWVLRSQSLRRSLVRQHTEGANDAL